MQIISQLSEISKRFEPQKGQVNLKKILYCIRTAQKIIKINVFLNNWDVDAACTLTNFT